MRTGKRLRRARLIGMVSLTLIIALLAIAYLGYLRVIRVKSLLLSGREHLRALEGMAGGDLFASLKPGDLKAIKAELAKTEADFRALKAEIGPFLPLCRYLSWIPSVGKDVEAAPHLLEIAIGVPSAARLALDGLHPLADLLSVDMPDEPSAGGSARGWYLCCRLSNRSSPRRWRGIGQGG